MSLVTTLVPRHITAQAIRFATAGATVAAVYIGLTLLLSGPLGVPIQIAIAVGYVLGVCLHFFLQRHFVFAHTERFALSWRSQVGRYVVIGATQYPTTALSTTFLPGVLDVSEGVVYVGTVVVLSAAGFLLMRMHVFHAAED